MPVWSNAGQPAGPAQLQADRLPDRVHPRPQRPDVHQAGPQPRRAGHRPGDAARRRRSPAGSTRTSSRAPTRRRSRTATSTSSRTRRALGLAGRRSAGAGRHGRPGGRPQHRVREQGPQGPGGRGVLDRVRQPGQRATCTTSRSRTRAAAQVFKGDLVTGPNEGHLQRAGAHGRQLPLRVLGPRQHDRHPHGRGAERWPRPRSPPRAPRRSAGGSSSACSTPTAGRGRSSSRCSGS